MSNYLNIDDNPHNSSLQHSAPCGCFDTAPCRHAAQCGYTHLRSAHSGYKEKSACYGYNEKLTYSGSKNKLIHSEYKEKLSQY